MARCRPSGEQLKIFVHMADVSIMCSVFKPKDEEPYGNLNPKVSTVNEATFRALTSHRRPNGYIANFGGLFRLVEHVSFQI